VVVEEIPERIAGVLKRCPVCGNHAWIFAGKRQQSWKRLDGVKQSLATTVAACAKCALLLEFLDVPAPAGQPDPSPF